MKRLLPYVGPLIGLTGVTLALYFHAQSVQERVPTFYVSPQRAVIVDARGPTSSDLQVLYRNRPVGASVTAVTVFVWNDGKLPIRAADVLGEPVSIELESGAEILEARILKTSRPVSRFSIGQVSDKAKNSLPLSFDILEQLDGAAVQLIYSGDPNASVRVGGTIVGAGSPKLLSPRVRAFAKSSTPKEQGRRSKRSAYSIAALGVVTLVYGGIRMRQRRKEGKPTGNQSIIIVVGLSYLVLGAFLFYQAHMVQSPGVPPKIWTEG